MGWEAHREEILRRAGELPGSVALWIGGAGCGAPLERLAGEPIEAASVIKLTVMAEAFRQKEAGILDFGREIAVRPEDKLPSCGALTYMHDGLRVTVGDLVTLMIILSDNTATNLLIDLLGMEEINAEIDRLGMRGTRLRRKLFRPELSARGIRNTVTARDMAELFEKLLRGECVGPDADREMLRILRCQRLNGKMPFYLHGRGIPCAHKTGEDDGITHDVGVIGETDPVIFCFLSGGTDVPEAERLIQDIGRWIGEAFA